MNGDGKKNGDGLLQWFFDIPTLLDERGRSELRRIGTNAFIFMFFYQLVLLAISLLLSLRLPMSVVYPIQTIAIIVGLCLPGFYVGGAVMKTGLSYTEVRADRYQRKRREIITTTVINTVVAFVLWLPISAWLDTGTHDFWSHVFSIHHISETALLLVTLSVIQLVYRLVNLRKIDE